MDEALPNPFDTELSEQRLLGSLLGRPANWQAVAGVLTQEDFFNQVHGRIYETISIVYGEGQVPTAASLAPYFAHDPDLGHLPGKGLLYISDLEMNAMSALALPEAARTIKRMATRRRVIAGLDVAKTKLSDPSEPIDPIVAELTAELSSATASEVIAATFDTVVERIAARMSQNHQAMPTGIRCLDDAMSGGTGARVQPMAFAAAAKVGKTTLALSISHNLNMNGVNHAYIAYEMGMEEIVQRQISRHMRWSPSRFRGAGIQDRALEIATRGLELPRNVLFLDRGSHRVSTCCKPKWLALFSGAASRASSSITGS